MRQINVFKCFIIEGLMKLRCKVCWCKLYIARTNQYRKKTCVKSECFVLLSFCFILPLKIKIWGFFYYQDFILSYGISKYSIYYIGIFSFYLGRCPVYDYCAQA